MIAPVSETKVQSNEAMKALGGTSKVMQMGNKVS